MKNKKAQDFYEFHTDYSTCTVKGVPIKIPKGAFATVIKNENDPSFYTLTSDQLFHGESLKTITIHQNSLDEYASNLTKNNWEHYRAHKDMRVIGTNGERWVIPRGTIIHAHRKMDKSYDYKAYKILGENANPALVLNMYYDQFEEGCDSLLAQNSVRA